MRSQKGITLTSLIIYIIVMLITISIISVFSSFFYKNVDEIGNKVEPSAEITRFNSFFVSDINKTTNSKVLECYKSQDLSESYVILEDGTQYTYKHGGIYRGKVKICDNIYQMYFENQTNENGKSTVDVKYILTRGTQEKTNSYTL